MAKIKISITIDENTLEKIKILAERDRRTLSQFINTVLDDHVNIKTDVEKL